MMHAKEQVNEMFSQKELNYQKIIKMPISFIKIALNKI